MARGPRHGALAGKVSRWFSISWGQGLHGARTHLHYCYGHRAGVAACAGLQGWQGCGKAGRGLALAMAWKGARQWLGKGLARVWQRLGKGQGCGPGATWRRNPTLDSPSLRAQPWLCGHLGTSYGVLRPQGLTWRRSSPTWTHLPSVWWITACIVSKSQ